MRDLARRLKGAGIEPGGSDGAPAGTVREPASALTPAPSPAGAAETSLLAKVLAKAEQIRTRWQENAAAETRAKAEPRPTRKPPARGRKRGPA